MDEFQAFIQQGLDDLQPPATLEEISKRLGVKGNGQRERLEKIRRDGSARVVSDALDVEQLVTQARIGKVLSTPVEPGQVFSSSGAPLHKSGTETPEHDPLLVALESEHAPADPLAGFESVPRGRIPLAPGPGITRARGHGPSIIDKPLPDVLSAIAERVPAGSRAFVQGLVEAARGGAA